ncbi:MAG: TPM domain-containing protein, partial [Crocinitomicaceae bacterium]|nr:TPM domain-containing protein [Crocinitomicaceae bacterium]
QAELGTSGEIRVHIDKACDEDPIKRAIEVFEELRMHETQLRNGVLIFIAFSNQKLAIIGDKGINELVPSNFWNSTRDVMIHLFKQGKFTDGICAAVKEAGEQLATYFPLEEGDVNELSNKISTNE